MEVKLRRKYRVRKPTQEGYRPTAGAGNSGNKKKAKIGPKVYKYGSRVRVVDGGTGHHVMVDGQV